MAAVYLASDVLTHARRVLRDTASTRWSDAVLLGYLSNAQLEIAKILPGANSKIGTVLLSKGAVRHDALPERMIRLLRVERNLGPDGASPGPIITKTEKDMLDASNSNWSGDPAEEAGIVNWAMEADDGKRFYTYPRAHPSQPMYVEIIYSAIPSTLTATDDAIEISPEYKVQLEQFVAGWALMEDEPAADFPRGQGLIDQARAALGVTLAQDEEAV